MRPATTPASRQPVPGPELIAFHATKYGREILVDTAWVHEMPTFILDRPHALRFYEIMLVTRGKGWFWLDGTRHAVRPHVVLFSSPGEVRSWQVSDLDGICLFFPALFLEEFFQDPMFLHRLPYFHAQPGNAALRLPPSASVRLRRKLLAMHREMKTLRGDVVHLLRARLYELLIMLGRDYTAANGPESERSPHFLTMKYGELVERDAFRRHQVADYARELGVSPGHLNLLCKRHLGSSAKKVIQDRLTTEARRLLLYSSESAERIAHRLGFDDPSYFTRFFRRASGRSPGAFRGKRKGLG